MTLISMQVTQDKVVFVTDSLSTSDQALELCFERDKVRQVDGPSAFTACGPVELGARWHLLAQQPVMAGMGPEQVSEIAGHILPRVWSGIDKPPWTGRDSGLVLYAGWSDSQRSFLGYKHDSARDFRGVEVVPGAVEGSPAFAGPLPAVGATDREWAAFAWAQYEAYSLVSMLARGGKLYLGGPIVLSELTRGGLEHRQIGCLPMGGWQLRKMLVGSLHPYGQLGPCICGNGKPMTLCHLRRMADTDACPCGEGRPFFECRHYVDPDGPVAAAHWRVYGRDLTRWNDELRESFQAFHRRVRANDWAQERALQLAGGQR